MQAAGSSAERQNIDFDSQLVSGSHGTTEARALDTGEDEQLVVALGHFGEQQRSAGLCHGFHDQHPRHDGKAREMALEKGLIDRYVLDGDNALGAHDLHNAIEQQHGIAMRQDLQQAANIELVGNGIGLIAHFDIVKTSIIHSAVVESAKSVAIPHGAIYDGSNSMRKRTAFDPALQPIAAWLDERKAEMVATVRELVIRESPTNNKQACDAICEHLAGEFACLGGAVKVHQQAHAGNHLQVDFAGPRSRRPILLLGHFDTVYELGTLDRMPWREGRGKLSGPGVFDMKAGIVQMMYAVWSLRDAGGGLPRPVKVLLVSDEEEGSGTSRALTERLAKQCCAVLVCEPSGPGGALKTARKGVGAFTVKVTGVSAHSGLDFEKGQSAIVELAHQIHAISRLSDLKRGVTLNVGVIRGGSRTNVVPAEASADLDLRIWHKQDGPAMAKRLMALKAVNRKCKLQVEGGVNRPPLERTKDVAALFELARAVGADLGFPLSEIAVGGGSDGNFTAGLGIPTLDGLGAVGDGAHAVHEHVIAAELPRRAALLSGLIRAIS